jgi:hypothetical protein
VTSDRLPARAWRYPRPQSYEDELRLAAATWFADHGKAVSEHYPFILKKHDQWPENIILPEVARFIQGEIARRKEKGLRFALHRYVHHGLSSQAMLFNLIGPLIVRHDLEPLRQALAAQGVACPTGALHADFEVEDWQVFNEDRGQPTSLDLVLSDDCGSPRVLIEAKLVEMGFGGCSVFADHNCDGRNPAHDPPLCYLNHVGRRYWALLADHGFLDGPIGSDATCILANHYQFFREVLFALQERGTFVVLCDGNSPTFYHDGPQGVRGLVPFLSSLMPESARERVATVTIQQVVDAIKDSGRHEWIAEFQRRYGLTRSLGG